MADSGTLHDSLNAGGKIGGGAPSELSFFKAIPYFSSIAIFPFVAVAALYGGWWLAAPFVFLWLVDFFDTALGTDEINFNPNQQNSQLFWYKLAVWCWVAIYPIAFIFAFRQVFVADHLALWEDVLIVLALGGMARLTLNVGHDMMHRRTMPERRIGEIVMASVSFPQEVTEHVLVHHAHIGTPKDAVSAPKGQGFWQYLPQSVFRSYKDTWIVERDRLARRRLPVWHHTNPVWRYVLETAAWYALAYWIGGVYGLLVFAAICAMGIFQLRMVDYIQHYGLQRVRLPGGRFERVRPRHSWSVAYKLPNWFYYNAQRHADHHMSATRLYPLLQHSGPDEAPQLPGSYSEMGNLVLHPKRWFKKMDPLVDQWRAHFYPEIDDWRAYDSAAYRARPDAFEEIDEICRAAPDLADWINRDPGLLDGLESREFTDLDLPDGFGPDTAFETLARRGLARVYWTHELDVAEMRARIADVPVRDVQDAIEAVRNWSNDKVFQVSVHVLRGNLSPGEAGTALSNIAEATVSAVLSAVSEDFAHLRPDEGIVVAMLGDLASCDAVFQAELDVLLLHEGKRTKKHDAMFRRFREALQVLSRDNLLLAPIPPRSEEPRPAESLADFSQRLKTAAPGGEALDLIRARRVFTCGNAEIGGRFDEARLEILRRSNARDAAIAELGPSVPTRNAESDSLSSVLDAAGGYRDVELAARHLQLTHAATTPAILAPESVSVFRIAGERGTVPTDVAARLAAAAELWRDLRGILRLVGEHGGSVDTASGTQRAVVARACGEDSFDALTASVRKTATAAASGIHELRG
ncbi:MAG: hypothetical protein F4213_08600 [Boseongicola sp. SB0677_bin_26]|nr:hypothetical protein [Boseongicola sp. SB0665_bin_10]MYG26071.1 hypothetical protein [Boseongicola sp. SB0677_bin_26]